MSPGLLSCQATGEPTASGGETITLALLGRTVTILSKRGEKQAMQAHLRAGPQPLLTSDTSQQSLVDLRGSLEAADVEMLGKPLSLES